MKKFVIIAMVLASLLYAQASGPLSNVFNAMSTLCSGIKTLIPVASMLMLVIAAVIYAAGQMMGAETRARANVWATAALVGALIGVLIVAIAPTVIGTMLGPGGAGSVINACG